jgi:hypothetical protein
MKGIQGVLLGGLLLFVSVGIASAQGKDAAASGAASAKVHSGAAVETQAPSTDATLQAIRDRAKHASAKARGTVDKRLSGVSGKINADAKSKGEVGAAGRVAPEFGMTGDALVTEATQFGGGLGEVIIAHTLIANSKTPVTMDQIFTLRKDGMGWGQIAQGMNLRVGDVVSAVMSEGKVAHGTVKADGKTAMIHSGSTQASTHAGLGANVKAGHTGTGAATSMGVGVGAKVGK